MSYLERTARKLQPILAEVKKKMISEKVSRKGVETLDTEIDVDVKVDMKNILGYLN